MSGDIKMTMTIYYASRRPDLDETLILDLLQGFVYINDRQVKERHTYWALDPDNPRAEILIEQLPKPEKKPARRRAKGKECPWNKWQLLTTEVSVAAEVPVSGSGL